MSDKNVGPMVLGGEQEPVLANDVDVPLNQR